MIVGFPGETEEEFMKTLSFIEKCAFSSMHIFPYSRRAGTPAAKMENQITKSEKASRARRAGTIARELEDKYLSAQVGLCEEALFEEISDGYWSGHTRNYVRVYAKSTQDLKNSAVKIKFISPFRDGLMVDLL